VAIVTLGCDKNTVDSERMMAALLSQGATLSADPADSDVIVVNTCGFIDHAKQESIDTLLEAVGMKGEGQVKAVAAVGCMVERYKAELSAELPEVDLFLGLTDLDQLVPELQSRGVLDAEAIPVMERPLRVLSSETPHTSFLKISEGCDHTCAFCAIPLMRGLHRSHPVESLVQEARSLGESGVKEISIISQDTTWYGRDLARKDRDAAQLPELLRALLDGTDVPWYRLFYLYPSGISDELISLVAQEPRILSYLDLPLQHGSDRMLKLMRRPERQATIRDRVGRLRGAIPDLTLRTTIIVGFPGETDKDFRELLDLLEELQFDHVGAFAYSREEGTRAAEMEDQVPGSLAAERLAELGDVQAGISLERNATRVGSVLTALVDRVAESEDEWGWEARIPSQAPDLDGVTYLPADAAVALGEFVSVEILDAGEQDLFARLKP